MSWKAGKDYDMIFGWAFDRAANVRKDSQKDGGYSIADVLADVGVILTAAEKYVLPDEEVQAN